MRKVPPKIEKCQKMAISRDLELGDDLEIFERGQKVLVWAALIQNMSIAELARTITRFVNCTCAMSVFDIFNVQYFTSKFKMAAMEPEIGPGGHKSQNPIFLGSTTSC